MRANIEEFKMSYVICPRKGQGCPSTTGRHRANSRAYQECLEIFTKGTPSKVTTMTTPPTAATAEPVVETLLVEVPLFLNENDLEIAFRGGETSDSDDTLSMEIQYGLGDLDYLEFSSDDPRVWHGKTKYGSTSETPYSDLGYENREEIEAFAKEVYQKAERARLADPLWEERSQREQEKFLIDSVLGKRGETRMDEMTHKIWTAHRTTPIAQIFDRQKDIIKKYNEMMAAKDWVTAGAIMPMIEAYGDVIASRYGERVRREPEREVDDFSTAEQASENFLYLSDEELDEKRNEYLNMILLDMGVVSLNVAKMGLKGIEMARYYRENYRPFGED